jgi:hypothetical protein
MIVVLDSNVWLKELALNSNIGAALRFHLKQQSARLAVPEVVRLEVKNNLRSTIKSAIEDISRGNRQLLALFGTIQEAPLPGEMEISKIVDGIFDDLGVEIINVPFTLECAHASFLKTIRKEPPSDKTQEFKDGVLWENCLELLDEDQVLLVTNDKAFYHGRDLKKGLAKNLMVEAKSKPNNIIIVESVLDVLTHVRKEFVVDEALLFSLLLDASRGRDLDGLLASAGAEIAGEASGEYELFITENPDNLYIKYTVVVPCLDVAGDEKENIMLLIDGGGIYKPVSGDVLAVSIDEERVTYRNKDGSEGQLRHVFSGLTVNLGSRTIVHTVKCALNGGYE